MIMDVCPCQEPLKEQVQTDECKVLRGEHMNLALCESPVLLRDGPCPAAPWPYLSEERSFHRAQGSCVRRRLETLNSFLLTFNSQNKRAVTF